MLTSSGAEAATGDDVRRRRPSRRALLGVAAFVALYFVVPRLGGLEHTWQRIRDGSPGWIGAAIAAEAASFAGYVWLLRRVAGRVSWRDAWQITLAGVAATRVVTVAGAGGIAVTIGALRHAGYTTREAAERQAVDIGVLYGVFFGLMLLDGLLLALTGTGPHGLTLVPAGAAAAVIAAALATSLVPGDVERTLQRRFGRRGARLAAFPAVVAAGVRGALSLVRQREPALAGAVAWWILDVAALAACVRAFGGSMGLPELLMAYLAGHAFNVLPVPGGVGPVEGGIVAALIAFGEPAGLALVAVLSYQLISVWLPAAPGAVALARLRRVGAPLPERPP